MAATTAHEMANFVIHYAKEHGDCVTPQRLQKLVFYADVWHMVLNDGPISGCFEAWYTVLPITALTTHWNPFIE